MRKIFSCSAIAVIALALGSSIALAGNHSNSGVERPGQVCADTIRHKHPELKGAARAAEWGKCKADPVGYLKANS
ncbi:MAG TPA: hypothetical protein VKV96_05595 [Roseiarcus sp.]|nr:hypothetical protein [Roseiarcus sp.]